MVSEVVNGVVCRYITIGVLILVIAVDGLGVTADIAQVSRVKDVLILVIAVDGLGDFNV